MKINIAYVLAALFFSTISFAGTVTIPNTFAPGQTASAQQVNDNFTALETAVDDNAANINVNSSSIQNDESAIGANSSAIEQLQAIPHVPNFTVYDATGEKIGIFMGYRPINVGGNDVVVYLPDFQRFTTINRETGFLHPWVNQVYYNDVACIGNAYLSSGLGAPPFGLEIIVGLGMMTGKISKSYVVNGPLVTLFMIESALDSDGNCTPAFSPPGDYYPLLEVDLGFTLPVALPINILPD